MRVHAIQFDIAWETPEENLRRVRLLLDATPPEAGALIVLPEMFATGFSMRPEAIAEPEGGPAHRFLAEPSRRFACWVLAGLARRTAGGGAANDALLLDPSGRLAATYSKRHLFTPAGEPLHYQPGNRCLVHDVGGVLLSAHICYDLRFPEDFREASARGAQMHVVVANWPAARQAHWNVLLAARAIENQAYVLGVNRCGADPSNTYAGGTCLLNPRGETVASLADTPGALRATVDPDAVRDYRRDFPALADRRDNLR